MDETSPQAPKKEEKKIANSGGGTGGRGAKKAPPLRSGSDGQSANTNSGGSRTPSRSNSKRSAPNAANPAQARLAVGESVSRPSSTDSHKRKEGEPKKQDNRQRNGNRNGNGANSGGHRKAQSSTASRSPSNQQQSQLPANPAQQNQAAPSKPVPTANPDGNLSSLQRAQKVIQDSMASPPSNPPSVLATGAVPPRLQNIPNQTPSANAPPFHPSFAAATESPRHRKAVSVGNQLPPQFNAGNFAGSIGGYSPHLGPMMEDAAEDGLGQGDFEEGEIPENIYTTQQPGFGSFGRGQAANQPAMGAFTAPRFAALAAQQQQQQQQQQQEPLGPTGRPQLAPNFMFGARRKGSTGPIPAIGEEDLGFQFPQQGQQVQQNQFQGEGVDAMGNAHRRAGSEMPASVTGLMAEQVRAFTRIYPRLCDLRVPSVHLDGSPVSDRGAPAATTTALATTVERGQRHVLQQ